jgi:hypothetical protein
MLNADLIGTPSIHSTILLSILGQVHSLFNSEYCRELNKCGANTNFHWHFHIVPCVNMIIKRGTWHNSRIYLILTFFLATVLAKTCCSNTSLLHKYNCCADFCLNLLCSTLSWSVPLLFLTSRCHQHFWPCLMFLATANTFCAPYSESFSCKKLVIPGFGYRQEQEFFLPPPPKRSDHLWSPPSLPYNWVPESFLGGKAAGA